MCVFRRDRVADPGASLPRPGNLRTHGALSPPTCWRSPIARKSELGRARPTDAIHLLLVGLRKQAGFRTISTRTQFSNRSPSTSHPMHHRRLRNAL